MDSSTSIDDLADNFHTLDPLDFYESCLIFPEDKELADLMDVLQVDACNVSRKYTKPSWDCFDLIEELDWSIAETQCGLIESAANTHIPSPFPFEGATATLITSLANDFVYILFYGGKQFSTEYSTQGKHLNSAQKSRLFLYNVNTSKWYSLVSKEENPPNRWGHCCALLGKNKSILWVFGGKIIDHDHQTAMAQCTNEVLTFSLQDCKWVKRTVCKKNNLSPSPRYDACAILVSSQGPQGTIVLYGGKDSENNQCNELWLWDISSNSWEKPLLMGVPPSVAAGTVTMVEISKGIILFWEENKSDLPLLPHSYNEAEGYFFNCQAKSRISTKRYITNIMAILDLKKEFWIQSNVLSKSDNRVIFDSLRSLSLAGKNYTYMVILCFNRGARISFVVKWRWTLSVLIRNQLKLKRLLRERKNSICLAIEILKKAQMKTSCEKTKETYFVCELTLRCILYNKNAYPTDRSCHVIFWVGLELYVIGGFKDDEHVDTIAIIPLETPCEIEKRNQREEFLQIEQKRLRMHQDFVTHRDELILKEEVRKETEAKKGDTERRCMNIEDELSRLPPLSTAPAVQLKFATKSMIWVKWSKVISNSRGLMIQPDQVEYVLKVRGGFTNYYAGMRVIVNQNDPFYTKMNAIVRRTYHNGFFDVLYDDGIIEREVSRRRISPTHSPWQVVFSGKNEYQYALQAIPHEVLEREKGIKVSCEFLLQTKGTEIPLDEFSLPSEINSFSTSCDDENHFQINSSNTLYPRQKDHFGQKGKKLGSKFSNGFIDNEELKHHILDECNSPCTRGVIVAV